MTPTETLHKKLIRLVLPISFQQFMLALVGVMAAFIIGENMFVAQYAYSSSREICVNRRKFCDWRRISCDKGYTGKRNSIWKSMQSIQGNQRTR